MSAHSFLNNEPYCSFILSVAMFLLSLVTMIDDIILVATSPTIKPLNLFEAMSLQRWEVLY